MLRAATAVHAANLGYVLKPVTHRHRNRIVLNGSRGPRP